MVAAEESLWYAEVPNLSRPFPMFLVDRDLLRVHQNCLPCSDDPQVSLSASLQCITRVSSCSLSAMPTVKQ